MTDELISFLMCILLGMGIGILFDIFRIVRKIIHHNNVVVIIQDCVFCICSGVYVFYLMYILNSGQFRFYMLMGIIISNIIYFLVASKHFINILVYIFTPLKYIIEKITIKNK